jgi:GTP-binding protein HflX
MKQRNTQRRGRQKSGTFTVSLVGYTNAGKSTLFNALVKARAYAADQLFATLDTTTRSLFLQELGTSVSLSDTVGFIRDLPHGLVSAFAATLQEAAEADVLLHVVDCANPAYHEQIGNVLQVLADIGAAHIPQVLVFNKLDALPPERRPLALQDQYELTWPDGHSMLCPRVFLSAGQGENLDALRRTIATLAQAPADQGFVPDANDPRFA